MLLRHVSSKTSGIITRHWAWDDYLLKPFSEDEMYYLFGKYFSKKAAPKKITPATPDTAASAPPAQEGISISLKNIRMFTGDDDEALMGYLESFSAVNKASLEKLEETLESHNVQDVSFYAHKMFPGVQQLEVKSLAARLRKLESLATPGAAWDQPMETLVQETIRDTQGMLVTVQQQMEELDLLKS